MTKKIDKKNKKKLSITIKKLDTQELRLKQILKKLKSTSREIDMSTLTSENEVVLSTTKIEKIKAILRTSYEYLTKEFEIGTEKDGKSFN
tara:strand:+ start:31 stop:300 length:270 start_codon:yes stop_codon:yes gene_type:complete